MNVKIKVSLFLIVLFLSTINIFAQVNATSPQENPNEKFDIKDKSFLLPLPQESGHYSSAITLLSIFVPEDWTLDMIKAPMFSYAGKYSLPKGFNVQASLATIFVSNRIMLGPYWNYSINNCHLGVGYNFVYNYGILKQFGYQTTLTGWEQQPSVLFGYSFQTMALTLRGDIYLTTQLNLNEGGHTVEFMDSYLNGYSLSLNLEQRITKSKVMSVGFKCSYLRYHILAWPAFPVNTKRYGVPEVQLGLNF